MNGQGFFKCASGFDYVEADVTAGGGTSADRAYLYDSDGSLADDTFYGDPGSSRMVYNSGVEEKAIGFDVVKAYATGWFDYDEAYLTGSAADDRFYSYETHSYLEGPGFFNFASGFDHVEADVTAGAATSDDLACLYDSPGNDTFYGDPGGGSMARSSGGDVKAIGFDVVKASAIYGGVNDRAYLTGSAGDDRFYGYELYGYLKGAGFYHGAKGFDFVRADAGSGTNDQAFLYGSAGDDRLFGYETHSYLYGAGFCNYAVGFDHVRADVTSGGAGSYDRGYLYDSAGNDTFAGQTTYGELLYGLGPSIRAISFDHGQAVADDRPDHDTAIIYTGTPWRAISDWENIHAISLASSDGGLSGLDLSFAGWIATLKDAKTSSNGDTEEVDLNAVDWLFAYAWD